MSRLISPDDVALIVEKTRSIGMRRVLKRILGTDGARTEDQWSQISSKRSNWWDLDAVTKRWNWLITGSPDLDYQDYVTKKYFHRRKGLKAISIGCGTGRKEIRWAETGKFKSIHGYDISESRIDHARELARKSKWHARLDFNVGNVYALDLARQSFDLVIFDNSLHHCSPLTQAVERAKQWLTNDGILVLNEYVGPNRFQWSDGQVAMTNALLQLLPARLRKKNDGKVKDRMLRPGALAIRMNDPSEAAESNSILDVVERHFEVLELKPYGGTILANLLKDIAHNFLNGDRESREWLAFLFNAEDRLIASKEISSDYVFGVYRKQIRRNPVGAN